MTLTLNSPLALQLTGSGAGITIGGDTNLYRRNAAWLATDSDASVRSATALEVYVGGTNGTNRGTVNPGLILGADTNLYRYFSGAAMLATDTQFFANRGSGSQIRLANNAGVPTIWFGNASGDTGDTILFRAAADTLQTGKLNVSSNGPSFGKCALNVVFNGIVQAYLEVGAADSGGVGFRMVRVVNS